MYGRLILFPVNLSETPLNKVLPEYNNELLENIRFFIVEDVRTARRFLKKTFRDFDIESCQFFILNKHTSAQELSDFINPLLAGNDVGILSESGCPAIADPGADIVSIAQKKGIRVIPLVGPSSILLSLMGSGFNGQKFSFQGYLPVEKDNRIKDIKRLESISYSEDMTQIFIETPYRNAKLLEDLISTLRPSTKICVAFDLTGDEEFIKTMTVSDWKKNKIDLTKKPCIFLIYRG